MTIRVALRFSSPDNLSPQLLLRHFLIQGSDFRGDHLPVCVTFCALPRGKEDCWWWLGYTPRSNIAFFLHFPKAVPGKPAKKKSLWDNSGTACLSGGATQMMAGITQMIVSDGFCRRTDATARTLSAGCIKESSIHNLSGTKWLKSKTPQTKVHHKENRKSRFLKMTI